VAEAKGQAFLTDEEGEDRIDAAMLRVNKNIASRLSA
jgi:hypothetical protein